MKIKWADFQQSTRSRSFSAPVETADALRTASLDLIRSLYPLSRGIRLVGVTLSNFTAVRPTEAEVQLSLT